MTYEERTPLEAGFARVFDAEILPKLAELEAGRLAGLKKTYRDMALVLLGAVVLVGLLYVIWGEITFRLAPLVVLFAVIGLWVVWSSGKSGWISDLQATLMPLVCTQAGDLQHDPIGSAFDLEAMRRLKLLPEHDKAVRRSRLSGTHGGTGFEMVHARLTASHTDAEGRNRTDTVFSGLLFRIDLPDPVPGRIVLMRDRGEIGNKLAETFSFGSTRALPKVRFDHPAFEAAFEVYADHPDAAKALMQTGFLDALLAIGAEQGQGRGAQALVAGFEGQSFFLALRRDGSFLKMDSRSASAEEIADDLHAVFDDIALAYQIIDRLNGV